MTRHRCLPAAIAMLYTIAKKSFMTFRRLLCQCLAGALIATGCVPPAGAAAVQEVSLPRPGTLVRTSPAFRPATLRGMRIGADNPLRMEFLIDTGDDPLDAEQSTAVNQRLINYFLTALTVPEDQLWVNLSPEEADRIIADDLVKTEMGRDMLAMDYLLKQLMASMLYPEEGVGAEFWQRVHRRAQAAFGTTAIPTDTFNKIWIVPRQAHVHVQGDHVLIVDSELDVMLEEDYLSLNAHSAERAGAGSAWSEETKELIRAVVIPEIKKEINHGRRFANLRQIYHAMLLAVWYKKNLRHRVINRIYADRNLVTGIDHAAPDVKEKIYEQYLQAFRQGVFDYIREDIDPASGEPIPRRYFSGGLRGYDQAMISEATAGEEFFDDLTQRPLVTQQVDLRLLTKDLPVPAAANDRLLAAIPDPDYDLFRRLERAHFDYNVYGSVRDDIEYVGAGHSRRVFAIPQEYPNLIFKLARTDQNAEPPSINEAVQMSQIAERIGYETSVVDGIELIKIPGIAPFRYYGQTIVQLRGQPATDVVHFHELTELFAGLGIRWELSGTRAPTAQLKNIAVFPESVNGQTRLVARATDLKDFTIPAGADQAITASEEVRLNAMFMELGDQTRFLWTRITNLSKELAAAGQAEKSDARDKEVLAKLRLLMRTLLSMRGLPVMVSAQSASGEPFFTTSAEGVFYQTLNDIIGEIEGHISDIQKYLDPAKYGYPPDGMEPLKQSVLYLRRQIIQAEKAMREMERTRQYPVLVKSSGYRVFYDLLIRNLRPASFQSGFQGRLSGLGLEPNMPTVGLTNLRRIQEKLNRLLRMVSPGEKSSSEMREHQSTSTVRLSREIIGNLVQLIEVHERLQFPTQDTNQDFVNAVAAATTREMIMEIFGPILDGLAARSPENPVMTAEEISRAINGIDFVARRLRELATRSDYIFIKDETTAMILARLDIPLEIIDLAMTAEFDEQLAEQFRRVKRTGMMQIHRLQLAANRLGTLSAVRGTAFTSGQLQELATHLQDVEQVAEWFYGLPSVAQVEETEEALDARVIFSHTLQRRLKQLLAATAQTRDAVREPAPANSTQADTQLTTIRLLADDLNRFLGFLRAAPGFRRAPLLRSDGEVTVFDEYTNYSQFIAELRTSFGEQADRYHSPLRLVGSETFELGKLESLIDDLASVNRDLAFSSTENSTALIETFENNRSEIAQQIERWSESLSTPPEHFGEPQSDLVRRIVANTVRHFLRLRLRPLVISEIDPLSTEQRSRHVQKLQLQIQTLKERLRVLAGSNHFVFVRDSRDNRLRVGIDPLDMLDDGMTLRFLFSEFLVESNAAFETLGGLLETLLEITQHTNRWITQDQIVDLSERILFHLAEVRAAPSMQISAESAALDPASTDPLIIMHNTVFNALTSMEYEMQMIAMRVRDPSDTAVPDHAARVVQNLNYFYGLFKTLAATDNFPLLQTPEGRIVFDEALTFELTPNDLQREFQWEAVRLGTNMITVGDPAATPFGELNYILAQLQFAVDQWDPENPLAHFEFGLIFGNLQPRMLEILDELGIYHHRMRPSAIESKEDLARTIALNSVDEIIVQRLHGWIQLENFGFMLKSDAQRYLSHIRQELALAAGRINALARTPDYTFRRHDISGEFTLDISRLEQNGAPDQAALSMGDRLLSAHFRTVSFLGEDPSITFSDQEVDTLMYWLDSGSGRELPESNLFGKLIHQINMVYRKERGVNGLTKEWLVLLSEQLDIPVKKLKNIFRWFKFVQLNTGAVNSMELAKFFITYRSVHQRHPEVFDSFTYYVPPGTPDEEKLRMAAGNMETLTSMFSSDFINGETVLKADIPGQDYYVGLEFGVPENGFGLNMVIGKSGSDIREPFPGVFMRIGIDTQGPDMRINFMQGVAGMDDVINDEFVRRMGFHPGIALLYVATDLAYQGHVEYRNNELNPKVDPFRSLRGIRPEFIPSLRNRLSKATINIMKGYDDFGLRKKTEFSRWRSVTDLVRVLIPQRVAQRDLRARSITRLHKAFRNLQEIPAARDQAQLSDDQRIAVLEVASAQMFRTLKSDGPWHPDIAQILATLGLPSTLHSAVRDLVALNWEEGVLGPRVPPAAIRVGSGMQQSDQAQLALNRRQQIAVLEYVGEKAGTTVGTYIPNFTELLRELSIPRELAQEVYQWIAFNSSIGTFDFSEFQAALDRLDADEALSAEDNKGGIDLNPANLDLRQTGLLPVDVSGAPLPEIAPIQGLVPVLIEVTPVTNLPLLLGQSNDETVPGPSAALSPARSRSQLKMASAPTF